MVVYDESGRRIEEYDLDKGYLENKSEAVEHRWAVDSEEQGEWVTLKEYPETGGKDVEWRVTAEEQGHWRTTDAEGEEVADFDGTLSDDWPHDVPMPDVFEYAVYHPYTEEELAQIAADKAEADRQAQIADLKAKLADSDYVITKISEYNVSGEQLSDEDAERYAEIIEQRAQWRAQINELEA